MAKIVFEIMDNFVFVDNVQGNVKEKNHFTLAGKLYELFDWKYPRGFYVLDEAKIDEDGFLCGNPIHPAYLHEIEQPLGIFLKARQLIVQLRFMFGLMRG